MKRNLCVVSACLSLLVAPVWPAGAQTSEADWAFLLEINEVTNSIDKETARQARAQCATLGKRLESMEIASSLQRLYFEAEIDHCVFYAMNNGEFSDETGDQCSYHYSYATKLAKVVVEGRGQPGFTPELMDNFRSRLENAARMLDMAMLEAGLA